MQLVTIKYNFIYLKIDIRFLEYLKLSIYDDDNLKKQSLFA